MLACRRTQRRLLKSRLGPVPAHEVTLVEVEGSGFETSDVMSQPVYKLGGNAEEFQRD